MPYEIRSTKEFDDDYYALDNSERIKIDAKVKKLSEQPWIGKPLGYSWFRELKLNGKRVYFLIYMQKLTILLVAMSDKKTQQSMIDTIKEKFDEYKSFVDTLK